MNMRRTLTALLALALFTSALCACTKQPSTAAESPVAVRLGERVITLADVEAKYRSMRDLYVSYGYPEPSTSRAIEKLQDEAVAELVASLMLLHQADLLGIGELTTEQDADVRRTAEEQMESLITIYMQRARSEGTPATRRAAIRALEETMTEAGMGMTWDEYAQYLYRELYRDRVISGLKQQVTRGVTVTEDEIAAYYEETLSAQQKEYGASAAACVDALRYADKFGTKPVLYVPEGILRVRILTVDGVSMKAQRRIGEAYAELQDGADFADVLLAYGEDDDYTKYPILAAEGVAFLPDGKDDAYDARIYAAIDALSVGGYSEPVVLDDACVIANVVSEEESGVRTLAQTREAIEATLLERNIDAAWSEQKAAWNGELGDVIYYEDVYRGVGK